MRQPISIIILGALSSFLLLFSVLAWMSYDRTLKTTTLLSDISQTALPNMHNAMTLNMGILEIPYLNEQLAQANSQAMRRIVHQEILNVSARIEQHLLDNKQGNLDVKFQLIVDELANLNALVQHKLNLAVIIQQYETELYRYHSEALTLANGSPDLSIWLMHFSSVVTQANRSLGLTGLQDLRNMRAQLLGMLDEQHLLIQSLDPSVRKFAETYTLTLNHLLMADNGVIALRTEQLRVAGRVAGRSNFIRSLVSEFIKETDYEMLTLQQSLRGHIAANTQVAEKDARVFLLVFCIAFCFIVGSIVFLKVRVLNRLAYLKDKVLAQVGGQPNVIQINGNDEIADLAGAFNYYALKAKEHNEKVEKLSLTDALTGIGNRRAFDEALKHDIELSVALDTPICILMIDVDYFKNYNDFYGHQAGDECLRKIARVLQYTVTRKQDFVARYGGEEFICILQNTDRNAAKQVAQRILQAIEALNIEHKTSQIAQHITVSIGISCRESGEGVKVDGVIKEADKALYQAKAEGRNRVVLREISVGLAVR
ncbi:sensor domain-containing diguanylate cyclase [Nitrincola nitratireducens]|uniref:diguanylate cyclase n=1 Tax=Nitrincola nitratireducens TaxID=1229521 RepID=W9UV70_9GAMM|nr:GGDEF domain-containing protein [Nitrincola nitratireducens]EXJ10964.1 Bacteriophytochrome cph2 [Nitrincola nitratireducens]